MKTKVAALRKALEKRNVKGLKVLYNEKRQVVKLELDSIDQVPGGVVMAGRMSRKGDKLVISIPFERLEDAIKGTSHFPGKYGTRKIDTGGGQFIMGEYAELRTVGIDVEGSFTLDHLTADGATRVAETVPFKDGEF